MSITDYPEGAVLPFTDQIQFHYIFDHSYAFEHSVYFDRFVYFDRSAIKRAVAKVNKNCFWSVQGGAVTLGCSFVPKSQLGIVGDEYLTSIDNYDEFQVNLLSTTFYFTPYFTLNLYIF